MTIFNDNVFTREQTASADCYIFSFSNGSSLHYTSFDRDLLTSETPDGIAYTHIPIQRSEFENDDSLSSNRLQITAPQLNTFSNNLIQSGQISVVINKIFLVDKTYQNIFTGLILGIQKNVGVATAICASKMYYLEKKVPRVFFQGACNNTLFDSMCTLTKATYTVSCAGVLRNDTYGKPTIFQMTSLVVTVNGITIPQGDNNAIKGFWQLGQAIYNGEYRFITAHNPSGDLAAVTGTDLDAWGIYYTTTRTGGESDFDYRARLTAIAKKTLLLHYPFSGSIPSTITLTLVPGCDKSAGYCVSPYNNIANFIGFPYFPASDPTVLPVTT
jgi:hypothetical protein